MRNIFNKIIIIVPFLITLIAVPIHTIFTQDNLASVEEARSLVTRENLKETDSLQDSLNLTYDFVLDQFPGRNYFVKMQTVIDLALGKVDVQGTYYSEETGYIIPKSYQFSNTNMSSLITKIAEIADNNKETNVIYATVPSKMLMITELEPDILSNEENLINLNNITYSVNSRENIIFSNLASIMYNEYTLEEKMGLYYFGDYHWNGYGSSIATYWLYNDLVSAEILPEVDFESMFVINSYEEKVYIGDLYKRYQGLIPNKDVATVVSAVNFDDFEYYFSYDKSQKVNREDIIFSGINLQSVDYNSVYTNNYGYFRVENVNAVTDQSILIFKDSYQNPTTDFFSAMFKEVHIVDARYIGDISFNELIEKTNPDNILFMFLESNISTDLLSLLNK